MLSTMNLPSIGGSSHKIKDSVSPHKLALLGVIMEYCVGMEHRERIILPGDDDHSYTEREDSDFMFLLLQLIQSADVELKDLVVMLQRAAKPRLMENVMQRLEELSVDGVRAIMDLFQMFSESFFQDSQSPPLLSKTSVVGLFVRRMILAFDKLSFSQVRNLHTKYRIMYDAWEKVQRFPAGGGISEARFSLGDTDASQLGDASLSILEIMGDDGTENLERNLGSGSDFGRYSQRQAEYFIAQQASLLQYNEQEAMSPKPLQQKISELLAGSPDLAEAHYLSFLNYLRVQEYCGAVDSLYHYFDRQNMSSTGNAEDVTSRGYRYAALNMAALQYRFNHREEALTAVHEAISKAQENNDHICLQHALGWLQRLGCHGTGKSAYMLDRLVTKSSDLNLAYLMSLGVQAFAKHNALASAQPSSVFEYLLKSDIINCQSSMSDLMTTSYAQKAALWSMYGKREMSLLSSELLLHLNTQQQGVYHSAEAECLAVCNLAKTQANHGNYTMALNLIAFAKKQFPPNTQHSNIWCLQEQQLMFTRALHQTKWKVAENAISNMTAINKQEADFCSMELCRQKGEPEKALSLSQTLLKDCSSQDGNKQENHELMCRVLLVQGVLYCCTGHPTEAGKPLLTALTMAKSHHFTYLAALASMHLAYMQFLLNMPHQALRLIDEVLLAILTHGTSFDQAQAHYLWLRCRVAASKNDKASTKRTVLHEAVQILLGVIASFRKTEAHLRVKDAIYYLARLYHQLGYVAERNKCALEFRDLDQQYPTWHKLTVLSL